MADETVQVEMQPEEAVALAMCQDLIENHPQVVQAILVQHEVQPSTDPEENILKLAKLSAERGRFFNEDFQKGATAAGYYRTENIPMIVANYVAKHRNINNFQASYFSIKDLFKKKEGGTQVGNLIRGIFKKGDTATGGAATTPIAPADIAVTPAAQDIAKKVADNTADPKPKDDKLILGLEPWIFYTGLGFVIVLIIVIIILIIRASKKKKD